MSTLATLGTLAPANHAPSGLPHAVIFDMDGVLIDSEPLWRDGFRHGVAQFMTENGLPNPTLTDADLAHYEGGRVDQTLAALHLHLAGHSLSDTRRMTLTNQVVAHVCDLFRANPTPIHASVQTLRDMAALGIPVAIATSSASAFLDAVLETLDLAHLVHVRQSALLLDNGKPHPEVYLRALSALGVPAHQAIAIEDSMTGLESAVRAELPTLWFTDKDEAAGHAALAQRAEATKILLPPARLVAHPTVTRDSLLDAWTTFAAPSGR